MAKKNNVYKVFDKEGNVVIEGPAKECAKILGERINTFYSHVNRNNSRDYSIQVLKNNTGGGRPWKTYHIYERRTNRLLAEGSCEECCETLHVSANGFYSMVNKSRKDISKKYMVVVEEDKKSQKRRNELYGEEK